MAHNFGSLVFTPVVKALQERHGSRRQYARLEASAASPDRLGKEESEFLRERRRKRGSSACAFRVTRRRASAYW
jgi:hypothetical protein